MSSSALFNWELLRPWRPEKEPGAPFWKCPRLGCRGQNETFPHFSDSCEFCGASRPLPPPRPLVAEKSWTEQDCNVRIEPEHLRYYAGVLSGLYESHYQPPDWVADWVGSDSYCKLAQETKCYFPESSSMHDVKRLLLERQPVNIAMRTGYDATAMQDSFGFGGDSGSAYTQLFRSNPTRLPPNIAVYCRTPVGSHDGLAVHVINSIGFAFDSMDQPDAQYFLDMTKCVYGWASSAFRSEAHKNELIERLTQAYRLVFACARDLYVGRVCLAFLGGGHFASGFPGGGRAAYFDECYLPAICRALDSYSAPVADAGTLLRSISVFSMGGDEAAGMEARLKSAVLQRGFRFSVECRRVPDALIDTRCLYQNAWDPHSICGNGNRGDSSLDGFIGRTTAVGALTFVPLNPWIALRPVRSGAGAEAGAGAGAGAGGVF